MDTPRGCFPLDVAGVFGANIQKVQDEDGNELTLGCTLLLDLGFQKAVVTDRPVIFTGNFMCLETAHPKFPGTWYQVCLDHLGNQHHYGVQWAPGKALVVHDYVELEAAFYGDASCASCEDLEVCPLGEGCPVAAEAAFLDSQFPGVVIPTRPKGW